MIELGAGKFADADGHHFEQATLDFSGEVGVPFYAAYQHDGIGAVGVFVHVGGDAFRCVPERESMD